MVYHSCCRRQTTEQRPTTPHTQPLPGITCTRFSHPPLSLATTHGITICFLFLRVLRCFTSPRSPPTPMYSVPGDTTSLVPGFPIRTSSDPRSVDSSPRHIAASHVLHRLPVPRHPPCALTHLQTQKPIRKRNCTSTPTPTTHPERQAANRACQMLATTIHKSNTTPHHQSRATTRPPSRNLGAPSRRRRHGLVASKPNSVFGDPLPAHPAAQNVRCAPNPPPLQHTGSSRPTPALCGCFSWCSLERR